MELPNTEEWKFTDVKFLPIVKEYAKRFNLVETIDTIVDSQMDLSPGNAVLALIVDTISGRNPLYRLEESFQDVDTVRLPPILDHETGFLRWKLPFLVS